MRRLHSFLRHMSNNEKSPQLIMWYTRPDAPPLEEVPECSVRSYRPGDEEQWLALLQANGQLGAWDRARLDAVLGEAHLQYFVECRGRLAACTGINDRERDGEPCWEIGWVAVHPDFQGRGLGTLITGAALARAVELGRRPIYLLTDDFRVPALRCYLKLGFVPGDGHASYRERWRAIFAGLGENYRALIPDFIAEER